MYYLVNGCLLPAGKARLPVADRGFTLGDGVFETMRAAGRRIFRLPSHLSRLRQSAAVLCIPITAGDAQLEADLERVLEANGLPEAIVRLTISRGPGRRGLLPGEDITPSIAIQVSPLHKPEPKKLAAGLSAIISSIRRNETSPLSTIKSCNYLDNVLARLEAADRGADEALLLNTTGSVACCSSANVHLVRSGCVITPPIHDGVLPGITRQVVSELCPGLGLSWQEVTFDREAFATADEAFITNSVLGVVPLTAVAGRPIGSGRPGKATQRLSASYGRLLRSTLGGAERPMPLAGHQQQ